MAALPQREPEPDGADEEHGDGLRGGDREDEHTGKEKEKDLRRPFQCHSPPVIDRMCHVTSVHARNCRLYSFR